MVTSNWPIKKLGELIEERKEKNKDNFNLPVFTVSHLYGLIPYQKVFYKRIHSIDTSNYKIVRKLDFAFGLPTKDTLPFGILEDEEAVLVSPAYIVFSIKDFNQLHPKYLFYLFKTNKNKKIVIEIAKSQGATRHGLPLKFYHLANLEISLPPLPVQQKIVSILDAIQEAIGVQEKIIEKTKELKKSMMAELFKYGAPSFRKGRKLKKTELGEIPEDWEVVRLGEVCIPRREQVLPTETDIYVGLEHLDSGTNKLMRYGKGKEVKSLKNKFYPRDILYGKLRPYLDKAILAESKGICSTDLIVIKSDKSKVLPAYLVNLIHTPKFLNFAIGSMSGTNHPRTSWNSLKTFKFSLPPLPEQREIAEILETIDQKIEIEEKKKELYEELFRTMLNKLMNREIEVEKIKI